jgi:ubiquinone/menaquinone biosynthesis C-methylase UbiE
MVPKVSNEVEPRSGNDALAAGQDREALRFIGFCADQLVTMLAPAPGDKILDVACGTGAVTLAAAQAVAPDGRVMAVDRSEAMLARLEAKLAKFGIGNVDVHVMDGARLDFRRDYFRHVVCSLGIFDFAEPAVVLHEWWRVLRPGGSVLLTTFAPRAFEPLLGRLQAQLRKAGVEESRLRLPWIEQGQHATPATQLGAAGFEGIEVVERQIGYHLGDTGQWWEVVKFSGLRALLAGLSAEALARIEVEHLADVASLAGADGLWMDVRVVFARGRKPAV